MSGVALPLANSSFWWIFGLMAGVIPLLMGWAFNVPYHQHISALFLFLLLIAHARKDSWCKGTLTLAIGFGAHCAVAIGLTCFDPVKASLIFPDGEAYYKAQVQWILTGVDPE